MNTQTANYIELVASTAKNRMSSPIFTLKAIKAYVSDFRAVETTPLKEVSEVDFDKVNESLSALIELRTKAAFAACCDALMGEAQSAREANTIALRVNTVISEASKLGISVTSAQVLSTKAARDEKYFSVAVALAEVKKMAKKAKSTKLVSTAAFLMALTGAVAPAQAADQWSAIYGDVNNAFTEASGPNYSRAHDILSHRMGQDFNLDQIKHLASMMHIRAIGPYDINSTVISKLGTNTMKPTVIATALTAAIAVSAPAHAAYDATQARFAPQFAIYDQGFKTLLAGGTKTPLEVFNQYHIALGSTPGLSGDAINKHLETLGLWVVNGAVTYTDPNAPVVRNAKDMPSFADAQKNIDTANTANMGASKFDGKHVKTTSTAAVVSTIHDTTDHKLNIAHHADDSSLIANTITANSNASIIVTPPAYTAPTPQPVPVVAPAAPSVNVPATPVVASVASLTPATPAKPAEPTKLYNVINAAPVAPLAPTKIALKPAAAPAYETVNPVHNQLTSSTDLTGFVINPQTDNDSHTTTIAKDLVKPPVYVAPTPTPVSSGIPTKAVVNVPAQPVVAPAAIVAPATPAPAAIPQPKPYATGTVIVDHLPGKLILKADNLPQIDGFGSTSTTVAKPVVDSMNIAHNNPTGAPTPVKTPVATPTPAPLTITVDKSVNSVQSGGVVNPYTPVKTQPVTIQTIQDPDQVVTITKQDPVVATSVVAASQPVVLTTSNSPTPVTPTKAPVAQANTVNTTAPVLTVAPTTTAQAQPTTTPAVVTPPAYTAPVPTPIGSGVPSATQAAANQASAQAATPTAPTTPTTPAATTPATNTAATTPAATTPTATPAAQPATQTAQTQPTAQPAATPAPVATTAPVATAQTPAPAPASTIGANVGPSVVTSTPANTGAYAQQQAAMQQAAINANSQALHNVANQVDANTTALNAQGAQLDNLESSTNKRFSDLKSQVQKNRKQASQGVANVAAMANIPQVTDDQDFTVGAGVGAFDGQAGVAVGMSARISHSVTTKASVGIGSTGGATIGAGIAYGF